MRACSETSSSPESFKLQLCPYVVVVIVVQRSRPVRLRIRMAQYMSGSLRVCERTKKKRGGGVEREVSNKRTKNTNANAFAG